jgi:hypothetical protein
MTMGKQNRLLTSAERTVFFENGAGFGMVFGLSLSLSLSLSL